MTDTARYALDDTIAAVATPVGTGGIGIVRLSGPSARSILERVFRARHDLDPLRLTYVHVVDPGRGETVDSAALISGFRPHLIVADLPYGIQHQGELTDLLTQALPVWAGLLPPSGTLALAWESRRFPRVDMIELVESASPLAVLNEPPYDGLAHRVDRVIKERDVLVARLAEAIRE